MILLPWSSSFRRWSKSTRKDAEIASPTGYAMTEPAQRRCKILIRIYEPASKASEIAIDLKNSG